jgi:ATPase family associated with various cellular activities (AAA)
MSEQLPDPAAFGAAFQEFLHAMAATARQTESDLFRRAREHLQTDPRELSVVSADFAVTDAPNLQLALDAVLPDAELVGIAGGMGPMGAPGLSQLLGHGGFIARFQSGPVQYADVEVGDGRVIRCVASGLYLGRHAGVPVALSLGRSQQPPFGATAMHLEAISPDHKVISALLRALREAMRTHNVYRGKIVSLHVSGHGGVSVQFHAPRRLAREALVLPEGLLERLERHAIGIAREAARLREAGRHLRRGILLHGPPGTGKTLTVAWLLGAMPERTTVVLTGRALALVEPAFAIARELAPATIVLEDVDLIAAERTMASGTEGVLAELLNAMEGLGEDAELLLVLTTNRPDILEPALAARPGRVDLALELPLPDTPARERLLLLYAHEIELDATTLRGLVERSEGVTGAFIKELMRQAALRAALEHRAATGGDAQAALEDLLQERSALTRRLLGHGPAGAGEEPAAMPPAAMMRAIAGAGLVPPAPRGPLPGPGAM